MTEQKLAYWVEDMERNLLFGPTFDPFPLYAYAAEVRTSNAPVIILCSVVPTATANPHAFTPSEEGV